jgi:hypothetical protein
MINTQDSLIDRKQLIERYPALGAKRYRLDWLIRSRQLPIVKKNRSIFFNPRKIDEWINENEIKIED